MRLFRSKLFWGVICIALAAVIAFMVLPMFFKEQSKTATVLKLSRDVPRGTVLTKAMLTSTEVGAYGLPEQFLSKEEDAAGMVAADDLYAGEFVWKDRLISEEAYKKIAAGQSKGLSGGSCLVTLELPTASSGVASILRSGDTVDVYETVKTTEDEEQKTVATQVLTSMYVYDVLNRDLQSLSVLDELEVQQKDAEEQETYDFEPVFVVIRCTPKQAETLIRMEKEKSFHFILRKATIGG